MKRQALLGGLPVGCVLLLLGSTLQPPPPGDAVADLTTTDGLKLVGGAWRYAEATIVEAQGKTKDGKPAPTHDISPHAGAADFDDAAWPMLSTDDIHHAIGGGKLSFAWFRIRITVPEKVGETPTKDAAVLLDITIDDYGEVWVDGKLPRAVGQSGGSMVRGFNCPNRVLLTEHAKPGQTFSIAVFGANGPLSDPPGNFVWLRSASLHICPGGKGSQGCRPD